MVLRLTVMNKINIGRLMSIQKYLFDVFLEHKNDFCHRKEKKNRFTKLWACDDGACPVSPATRNESRPSQSG